MFDFNLMGIIAGLPGLVIALVVHEYAHARVAVAMGDFTPRMMGRLTLNPMAHIDPIGLLMLFIAHFGWAKPVMINPRNFRDWRKGEILTALAGPGANILTAFLALLLVNVYYLATSQLSPGVRTVFSGIIEFNINFAIFNMIPLPPLDGSKVLMMFLPNDLAYKYLSLERYSFIILIALLMTPVLHYILIPLNQIVWSVFSMLIHLLLGGFF